MDEVRRSEEKVIELKTILNERSGEGAGGRDLND